MTPSELDALRERARDGAEPDLATLQSALFDLGYALHDADRDAEEIAVWQELMPISRRLYDLDADQYQHDLGYALSNLGAAMYGTDRDAEAVATLRDQQALARDLEMFGRLLDAVGRTQEALAEQQEAVALLSRVSHRDLPQYLPDLASSLGSLALRQQRAGLLAQASATAGEGMTAQPPAMTLTTGGAPAGRAVRSAKPYEPAD